MSNLHEPNDPRYGRWEECRHERCFSTGDGMVECAYCGAHIATDDLNLCERLGGHVKSNITSKYGSITQIRCSRCLYWIREDRF